MGYLTVYKTWGPALFPGHLGALICVWFTCGDPRLREFLSLRCDSEHGSS
jgi:hypothetical protein